MLVGIFLTDGMGICVCVCVCIRAYSMLKGHFIFKLLSAYIFSFLFMIFSLLSLSIFLNFGYTPQHAGP